VVSSTPLVIDENVFITESRDVTTTAMINSIPRATRIMIFL
jgi:hypothetical protein